MKSFVSAVGCRPLLAGVGREHELVFLRAGPRNQRLAQAVQRSGLTRNVEVRSRRMRGRQAVAHLYLQRAMSDSVIDERAQQNIAVVFAFGRAILEYHFMLK